MHHSCLLLCMRILRCSSSAGTLESVLLQGRAKGAQQAGPRERTIIHLDMDCFFAAVAASTDPAFKGMLPFLD